LGGITYFLLRKSLLFLKSKEGSLQFFPENSQLQNNKSPKVENKAENLINVFIVDFPEFLLGRIHI